MDDRDDSRSAINLIMKMEAVKVVLEAKGSRLSSIVVRYNGSGVAERSETFLAVDVDEDTMLANEDAIDVNDDQYILRHVVDVLRVCDELTLVNYKPSKSITGSVWYMLSGSSITVPMSLMARLRSDHDKIDLGVTIPFLRFRAGEAATEQRRRFLAAANDNCPAVGEAVQQKVTTLFARWLEKLGDREWIGVCRFLKLFNSLGPDDNPHRWDTIDRFDLSQLNNLTFAALHGCFRDGRRHRK
ncbi:uncharacterized protein LOC129582791 [Paramacrobiotus metropolitanus]|uniref:uncharacterized protein LOC129582791 n=1 Tax=Paramacrobiotus metropolitanus TaxID=2943436 RepID=UPI0024457655|nr:uncharacterized protein LOC129582791 [Paramacrobiotus metropolitanus]